MAVLLYLKRCYLEAQTLHLVGSGDGVTVPGSGAGGTLWSTPPATLTEVNLINWSQNIWFSTSIIKLLVSLTTADKDQVRSLSQTRNVGRSFFANQPRWYTELKAHPSPTLLYFHQLNFGKWGREVCTSKANNRQSWTLVPIEVKSEISRLLVAVAAV